MEAQVEALKLFTYNGANGPYVAKVGDTYYHSSDRMTWTTDADGFNDSQAIIARDFNEAFAYSDTTEEILGTTGLPFDNAAYENWKAANNITAESSDDTSDTETSSATANWPVLSDQSHEGVKNNAEYTVKFTNDSESSHKTNTVTVTPETLKFKAEKKWQNASGTETNTWPEGASITFKLVKIPVKVNDKSEAKDASAGDTSDESSESDEEEIATETITEFKTVEFAEVPKLKGYEYKVVESVTGVNATQVGDAEVTADDPAKPVVTTYTFTNKVGEEPDSTPVKITVEGNKSLKSGDDELINEADWNGKFNFELVLEKKGEGDNWTAISKKETTNDVGDIKFDGDIEISDAGQYRLTLTEKKDTPIANVKYDENNIKTATFDVVDKDGIIVIENVVSEGIDINAFETEIQDNVIGTNVTFGKDTGISPGHSIFIDGEDAYCLNVLKNAPSSEGMTIVEESEVPNFLWNSTTHREKIPDSDSTYPSTASDGTALAAALEKVGYYGYPVDGSGEILDWIKSEYSVDDATAASYFKAGTQYAVYRYTDGFILVGQPSIAKSVAAKILSYTEEVPAGFQMIVYKGSENTQPVAVFKNASNGGNGYKAMAEVFENTFEDKVLIPVTVKKVWDDGLAEDADRGEVTVKLQKKVGDEAPVDVEGQTEIKLNKGNDYTVTITDLPQTDGDKVIEYSFVEVSSTDGYTSSVSVDNDVTTITNHKPEIEKFVKEIHPHSDLEAYDTVYDYEVVMYVPTDATKIEMTDKLVDELELVIDEAHPVTASVTDAKGIQNGTDITSQLKTEGTVTGSDKANKLIAVVDEISDESDPAIRGKYVTVKFFAKIKDGADITNYESEKVPNDAKYIINDNPDYGSESNTVTVTPGKTEVTVNKEWKIGEEASDWPEGATVKIQLQLNGQNEGAEITLDAENTSHTWTGLKKYEGKEYTVVETACEVPAATNLAKDGEGVVGDPATDANGNKTFTVTNKVKTEETTIKVSKTDLDGKEVENAQIKIYGTKTEEQEGEEEKAVIDRNNVVDSWTSGKTVHETTLQPGTYVMVEEVAPEGYKKVKTEITFTVDAEGNVTLVTTEVENGKVEVKADGTLVLLDEPEKPEIEKFVKAVQPHADLDAYDTVYDYEVVMYVPEDATKIEMTDELVDELELVIDETHPVTATVADAKGIQSGETVEFTHTGVNGGSAIVATVDNITDESAPALRGKYVTVKFFAKIKDGADIIKYDEEKVPNDAKYIINNNPNYGSESNTVTVTPKKVNVTVNKEWKLGEETTGWPEGATVKVQLQLDGQNQGAEVTLDAKNTSYTWNDLKKYEGKEYTVVETACEVPAATNLVKDGEGVVGEPTTDANGNKTFTVTNKVKPGDKTIKISKVNLGGTEIAEAKIEIKNAEGIVVDSWTSSADDDSTKDVNEGIHEFTLKPERIRSSNRCNLQGRREGSSNSYHSRSRPCDS